MGSLSEALDTTNFWFGFVWATARQVTLSPILSGLFSIRVGAVRTLCLHKGVEGENRNQSILRSCRIGVTQGILGCARPPILVCKDCHMILLRVQIVFFVSCFSRIFWGCKQLEW